MRSIAAFFVLLAATASAESADDLINRATLPDAAVLAEVKAYLHERVPKLAVPDTREAWETQAADLRERYLNEIVLRGVPESWTAGEVKVEYVEDIETGKGYRIRKLRYEAIPGMWIPALLYEPEGDTANLPGVLNVNGHYDEGKVREEEQIRCINFAKRGVVNIHPEWFRCGELKGVDNDHARGAYLDTVGVSMLSVFHLSLKRAMDILEAHPRTDPEPAGHERPLGRRLADRGLQRDGPAGIRYRAGRGPRRHGRPHRKRQRHRRFGTGTHRYALHRGLHALDGAVCPAPGLAHLQREGRLLLPGARTLPAIYDPVVPVYERFGAAADFRFHVNHDPGTHNYGQDNRIQFYQFVDEFLVPDADWGGEELPTEGEILPVEQTNVGIPADNATIVGTAIALAKAIERPAIPPADAKGFAAWQREKRGQLRELLNYAPVNLRTVACGLESDGDTLTTAYRFKTKDWTIAAAGILPPDADAAEVHIVLDNGGLPGAKEKLAALAAEGKQAVAVAPLFQDGTSPRSGNAWQYSMILNATGERSLAVQAAQLAAVCDWFKTAKGVSRVTLHAKGARERPDHPDGSRVQSGTH